MCFQQRKMNTKEKEEEEEKRALTEGRKCCFEGAIKRYCIWVLALNELLSKISASSYYRVTDGWCSVGFIVEV